jgi:hypothetical protein
MQNLTAQEMEMQAGSWQGHALGVISSAAAGAQIGGLFGALPGAVIGGVYGAVGYVIVASIEHSRSRRRR